MAKTLDDKVEGLYDRKKLGKSLIAGEIASTVGSGLGARIGEKVSGKLGGVIGGGIAGDYFISAPVGCLSWLYQNRDYYKGFKGKMEWLSDEAKYLVREMPAIAASYVAYAPILGLLYKGLGLSSWLSGGLASVLTSALYIGGSMLLGKGVYKRKKVDKSHKEPKRTHNAKEDYNVPGYTGLPQHSYAQ